MNDKVSKILLGLIAVALWGILLRSFFEAPALQAQSPTVQAKTADVITAHKFQLVDSEGKPCGSLSSDAEGDGVLFLGKEGKDIAKNGISLYNEGYGGFLDMFGLDGKLTVRLSAVTSDYLPELGGSLSLSSYPDRDRMHWLSARSTRLSPGSMSLDQSVPSVSAKLGTVHVPVDPKLAPFIQLTNEQVAPPKPVGH